MDKKREVYQSTQSTTLKFIYNAVNNPTSIASTYGNYIHLSIYLSIYTSICPYVIHKTKLHRSFQHIYVSSKGAKTLIIFIRDFDANFKDVKKSENKSCLNIMCFSIFYPATGNLNNKL